MNRLILVACFFGLVFCSGWATASDFDGSKPLVCAMVEVLDCGLFEKCERVNPEDVNLPNLFRLDIKKKEMSGADRKTQIKHVVNEEGNVILQGTSANGRAWSILLSENSGKFTGAVAGVEFGFLIFGSCITD